LLDEENGGGDDGGAGIARYRPLVGGVHEVIIIFWCREFVW
jgi:hypothetical protein